MHFEVAACAGRFRDALEPSLGFRLEGISKNGPKRAQPTPKPAQRDAEVVQRLSIGKVVEAIALCANPGQKDER
jgi:hypothetical protein